MHEIGCQAFVLILNKHNPKIYECSIECVLIGYDEKSKSYRCYNRATKQVHSSYHVRFIESHKGHTTAKPITSTISLENVQPEDEKVEPNLDKPIQTDDEDIPAPLQLLNGIPEAQPPAIEKPPLPVHHSTRISNRVPDAPTKLELAIQESRNSANQLKQQKLE